MSGPAYSWGSHAFPVDAQVAGERLELLAKRSNAKVASPEAIVDDARPEDSPLHPAFEWDNSVAAEAHRRWQARSIMGNLVITMPKTTPAKATRGFVNVTRGENRGYVALAVAMEDPELRRQVIQQAWRELQGWRDRYREYEELSAIFSAIDRDAERKAS